MRDWEKKQIMERERERNGGLEKEHKGVYERKGD